MLGWYHLRSRTAVDDDTVVTILPTTFADEGLLARFKPTATALPDALSSDDGRAGRSPSGFELLHPRRWPFRKASPALREGSQTTMRARPCPISVRIRELSCSSLLDHALLKKAPPRATRRKPPAFGLRTIQWTAANRSSRPAKVA